jgi:hypothetical protein
MAKPYTATGATHSPRFRTDAHLTFRWHSARSVCAAKGHMGGLPR